MSNKCEIATFKDEDNLGFMNNLIKIKDKSFIRRLDQVNVSPDKEIAKDNGTPIEEINTDSLFQILKDQECYGTYSYNVLKKNGEYTRIAIEFNRDLNLKEKD